MQQFINWKVAGAAGEGVKSTGLLFSKICLHHGLYTFDQTDYPSLIRGGHNTYQVHTSANPVYSHKKLLDLLVCLNSKGLDLHQQEYTPDTKILVDQDDSNLPPSEDTRIIHIPLYQLAKDSAADRLLANTVAVGASIWMLGLDLEVALATIETFFSSKGSQIIQANQKAAQAGYDYAKNNIPPIPHISLPKQAPIHTHSMTGNEAVSLGAIAGGLKLYIAYPMTPSSSILHTLAAWEESANIAVKHAEDEIGVINMALGGSFAGVRVAVGTSGGGFCYMSEAVGFSGVAELPLVIFESQRPGPALGMPTWTAQSDLLFIINASQDEFPRIVLAPGDVQECFDISRQAMQLAESYQLPVIVLLDKHVSESGQSLTFSQSKFTNTRSIQTKPTTSENGLYPRYQLTDTGISPRTIPGTKDGYHIANSYESDEFGLATEDSQTRIDQMDKRFRKEAKLQQEIPTQFYLGSENPDITFISFGSTKMPVMQAVTELRDTGINAAMLHLSWLWPFPIDQVKLAIERSKNPIVIEGNKTHQLARLIKMMVGYEVYHKRTKYDGRSFYPEEIIQFAHEIIGSQA